MHLRKKQTGQFQKGAVTHQHYLTMCISPAENFLSCFEPIFHIRSDVECLLIGQHLTKRRNLYNRSSSLPWSSLRSGMASTTSSVPMDTRPGTQRVPKQYRSWSGMNWVREKKRVKSRDRKGKASFLIFVHSSTICLKPHSLQYLHSFILYLNLY